MPLQGLADRIYQVLRQRVPAEDPRISYQGVVDALGPIPPPNDNLQAFDRRLFDALGEIGTACHAHSPRLPALSAVVVQKNVDDTLGMPGAGYYPVTHPAARSDLAKIEAWMEEFQQTKRATYPPTL
jgi:hypothetical protein